MSTPVILALIVIVVPATVFAVGVYLLLRTIAKVARGVADLAEQVNRALDTAPESTIRQEGRETRTNGRP